MSNLMIQFANNEYLRQEVKNYIIDFLSKEAVRKVFAREDSSHIADARDVIENCFIEMEDRFVSSSDKKINIGAY